MERSDALACYEKLIATNSAAELKGDTVPYTSVNGHMFSALHKDNTVALRLPEEPRTEFLKKYKTSLAAHYGVVQPEYVVVPDALLKKTKELEPYFAASYAYVLAKKPKPTTKKSAPSKGKRKSPRKS